MIRPFENKTYYALTLDPIHVGTGGYRLGRVDLSIVREPGTNLPKVPGTSLSGVARAYTAMAVEPQKYLWHDECVTYMCAGKGGDEGAKHCGWSGREDHKPACPVCISFGFSIRGKSFQGLAQFSDLRILFFPVYSLVGPVWVTSPQALRDAGAAEDLSVEGGKFAPLNVKAETEYGSKLTRDFLTFGWLRLEQEKNLKVSNFAQKEEFKTVAPTMKPILERVALLDDALFSQIVNSNLEVRTSVSIDPATGAAEEHALFTYEAIPRATVMWFTIVYSDPRSFLIDDSPIKVANGRLADIEWVRGNVEKGLSYLEFLGIGGMGTRGMGRLQVLNVRERR